MAKLTAKQRRFVEEYLIDLNATQAAIRAGYSVKNAGKIGPELLGKTRVAVAIKQAMAERSRRTGINQDRVLRELAYAISGSHSIKELALAQAAMLIDTMEAELGRRTYYTAGPGRLSIRQYNLIQQLANELQWDNRRLKGFIMKYAGVEDIRWLTREKASNVIEGLKKLKQTGRGRDRRMSRGVESVANAEPDAHAGQVNHDQGAVGRNEAQKSPGTATVTGKRNRQLPPPTAGHRILLDV